MISIFADGDGGEGCREITLSLRLYWGSGDEGVVAMVADVGVVVSRN